MLSVNDPWEKSSTAPLTRDPASGRYARILGKGRPSPIVLPEKSNYSEHNDRKNDEDGYVRVDEEVVRDDFEEV